MLVMAQVGPGDFVVDLGAGDGRTVIAAAQRFGARALGIEYDAKLVAHARRRVARAGLAAARARIVQGDIYAADFSAATVVTLYLMPAINRRLRPILLAMRPGTRVVSHQFAMDDWQPDETSHLGAHTAHLWIVPAQVAGTWQLALQGGSAVELAFDQKYQRIAGTVRYGAIQAGLREAHLRGDSLRFRLVDPSGATHDFTGRVSGDRMSGTVHARGKATPWSATRTAGE
jgi:SAM-dependent methyltransferase